MHACSLLLHALPPMNLAIYSVLWSTYVRHFLPTVHEVQVFKPQTVIMEYYLIYRMAQNFNGGKY